MVRAPLFRSFFMGGFECSTHRLGSGKRLDMLEATGHDQFLAADYQRLQQQHIYTVRSGLRWHLIEQRPNQYDFSSALPAIRTARDMGMQVIWDVCHYGWPDDIDIFTPAFVKRFAQFAAAFAHILKNETDSVQFVCPINEISFFSWGGGDVGYLNPFQRGRGYELKVQLARAAIEGIEAIWQTLPNTRIVHVDPVINIIPAPDRPEDYPMAEGHRLSQYQGWDLLAGRLWPQIGGDPKYLDILGLNYYSNNQWIHGGPTLHWHDPLYRPFRQMIHEVYERYQRPMLIAETGIENEGRPDWLAYVGQEAQAALNAGLPLEGVCLYPIMNHPGWDDERHCHNGLWDYAQVDGQREMYEPLGRELARQTALIEQIRAAQQIKQRDPHRQALSEGLDKPRICLFTDSLEPSGMGEHMLALATELCPAYEVSLICPATPQSEALLARARRLPITVLALEVRRQNRVNWETLRDWLRGNRIDIFHSHAGIGWEGHDAVYAAYHAGVPIIVRTEHLPYLITDWAQRVGHTDMMQRVTRLIAVSEGAYASFIAAGIAPEKLSVIRNGITPQKATQSRAQARAALKISRGAKVILTVGRLTEQKGHIHLLEAASEVVAAHPNAYFAWVGTGLLAESLRQERDARGLAAYIHFLGQRNHVADLLAAADLFVLPSLFEGLPLVVLEALAAGVPVIATQIAGTDEIISDGVSGRLVTPGSAEALAAAINEALDQPALPHNWKTGGLARFEQHFTARRMAHEVDVLYQELLQQAGLLTQAAERPAASVAQNEPTSLQTT